MKKILRSLLLLILVFPLIMTNEKVYSQSVFKDVGEEHWATKEIELLTEKKLINGYADGTFRTENPISRAESVAVLVRMLGLKAGKVMGSLPFRDVSLSHWSRDDIMIAYQNGLLSGYADGSFRPENNITRAEAAVLFSKAFKLRDGVAAQSFKDAAPSYWAYDLVNKLVVNELIEGTSLNTFEPEKAITRAEFSVVLARVLEKKIPFAINISKDLSKPAPDADATYSLITADWGIYKDGTHPVETTQGFNEALKWAHENGKTTFKVPEGTYLIKKQDPKLYVDTSARINMVPNMTFELDDNAIIQKETNGFGGYHTLHIGYGADNVTLKGGIYRGDKDSHDYSGGGTHEGGYGIVTEGANNLTIDGVKGVNFTGDGLIIGGSGTLIQDLYEKSFVSGAIDEKGDFVSDPTKIRFQGAINFNNPVFKKEREFEFSNGQKLTNIFDVYFYKEDGTFMNRLMDQKVRQIIQIPEGASYFYAVFNQSKSSAAYIEVWQRAVSKNVVVKNSEFAFNRRQGITIAGGDHITIINNELHDIKGTAPQAGIDVEAGYGENGFLNSNIFIKNNNFYNNAAYDVILYDGQNATVEGNHLSSKTKIGLAVSPPFTSALIKDNHFDGSNIFAYHDIKFEGNRMNDGSTHLEGPNLNIDGMTFTDSNFIVSSTVPFGITASNITMYNNKIESEMSLWVNPIHISNITMYGGGITGDASEGSIIDNFKVIGAGGLNLPPATYNNCEIESSSESTGIVTLDNPGKYIFNKCSFKVYTGILLTHPEADFAMSDSTFDMLEKRFVLKAVKAKRILFENNTITANKLENSTDYLVMIGDYWTKDYSSTVQEAIIRGNAITSNLEAEGISTQYAGTDAPPYTVENNVLTNAKLKLMKSTIQINNVEK
ncbi:hypothetical protein GC093_29615 [Paenibacillus sp. LMG 31456]|uniref:SLH domain-containing protein n=1 Tax=Paenibacillus foliorum TaxID=2654974 RepID=A0A972K5S2_9BACL|nr:S-layer homology domain-containing protein [Paenibacillus foliorum]NOU97357.1 hypothetical protein [Paenibacillus foliorum]